VIALAALGLVAVGGATTCPAPAEVEERLGALLPDGTGGDRATLSDEGGGLRVALRDAGGVELAARTLAGTRLVSCRDLADAAAATIAAWEAELKPGAVPAPSLAIALVPPVPAELALGVVVASGGAQPAFGGLVEGTLAGRRWRGWALGLSVMATGEREIALPPGRALFVRPQIGLGGRYRVSFRRLHVDLHGPRPLLGLVAVRGAGFDADLGGWGLKAGAGWGVRLSADLGPVAVWGAVTGAVWLPQHAEIIMESTMTSRSAALPVAEATAALGFAYGSGR
jgi:hypothetical protein